MEIKFINTLGVPEEYSPKSADKFIPDWYKNTSNYIEKSKKPDGDGQTTATIKKCMPVFDAMVGGYIIPTYVDIFVSQKDGLPYYEWPNYEPIAWHPIRQAPLYPNQNGAPYPKWINPWGIKTPKGYSCLFVQPFHRKSDFNILPGIVDTDEYYAPVNFPFVLNDISFEGLIPAGTPMAQVIPFKRDYWKMSLGNEKDLMNQSKVTNLLRTKFFEGYKSFFRQPKEYK